MSDTEWIYSLYIQANPVPDPDVLPFTEDEGGLVTVGRVTPTETREHLQTREPRRRTPWRTAAVAFVVVVLIGAVFGLLALLGGDEPDVIVPDPVPTVTFDGQTATYTGPASFDDNTITFIFNNDTDRMVGLGWNVMNDESITIDDEIAWMETHRGETYEIPPWVENYGSIGTTRTGGTQEATVEVPNGKCLLYVWEQGQHILYPAAHITIDTKAATANE